MAIDSKRSAAIFDDTLISEGTVQKRARTGYDVDTSTVDFAKLLDFTHAITETDIHARYDQIASALLHDYTLHLTNGEKNVEYEFLEIEFYLRKIGHEDPFTHGSEEQKVTGQWYFHRAPRRSTDGSKSSTSSTGYRGGTRKGLDLTIGGPMTIASHHFASCSTAEIDIEPVRGGVLLRSLRRVHDQKIISGPSLLVDEILQQSQAPTIAALVEEKWGRNTFAFTSQKEIFPSRPTLLIKARTLSPIISSKAEIYQSPRIGLDLSHPDIKASLEHPRVTFISRPYRYFIHPNLLTANGRMQTFLGVYRAMRSRKSVAGIDNDVFFKDEICRITGLKRAAIDKYFGGLEQGRKDCLKTFVGPTGKNISSSSKLYPRLMGFLSWGL